MNMKESIHYSFYAPELYFGILILSILAYKTKKNKYLKYCYYILISLLIILILFFYRRNTNQINMELDTIVSPCEGKILKIIKQDDKLLISVFLDINNVHIQYFPFDGQIVNQEYKKGEFHPAYLFEKSKYNEQLQTTLLTKYGDIKINQIAGLFARRIVSFETIHSNVKKGQPLGLIKFGSRVDTYLPFDSIKQVLVKENQFIKIGEPICRMKY
jgi:phosphatidylserine decarboxylase